MMRAVMREGAPPPWVPFGTRNDITVDTSQRSMDVAKGNQTSEEDPEFVRQRHAAIAAIHIGPVSKEQRFARQDVMRGTNVAKGFEQARKRAPVERPHTAASATSDKTAELAAAAAAIKANARIPEWAKNQIADEPTEEDKRRPQSDRKQMGRRNFDDDDDDRPSRGGGFGRGRRGRGRGRGDDGGEETRPEKDVTLFDFFKSSTKPVAQKFTAPSKATPQSQKLETKPVQGKSASNQPPVSRAVQKMIFEFDNGDQVLARFHEDNEYYPAIVMNIMRDREKCMVMFEGYDTHEMVNFGDIEPYEEGYYEEEEQEQVPPPPAAAARKNPAPSQHQQRNQPAYPQHQPNYGHQQQRDYPNQQARPNSGRGYPQQQQQTYPNRYNDNNYYY